MKNLLTLLACLWAGALTAGVINYKADDETVFPNPERGFTDQLGGEVALTDSKNHVVKPEEEWYWDTEDQNYEDRKSQSLVMLMYYLKNYKTKDLSDKILQGFDEDMQILRNHGFKCVLRFAYDWSSKTDASLQWVQRHAGQLKPYLAKNADVIYVMEAGFVGQWGEWYYSSNFGNKTQQLNANRRAVIDTLLGACPQDRFLLVRYPLIKTQYLGDEKALTGEEAHSGSVRSRIGHHNDAFLADWGNDGTYGRDGDGPDDDPVLRQYIAMETMYVPNGGETNVEDDSLAAAVYADAEKEMAAYHWSFCGSQYSEQITGRWRKEGIYKTLDRRLGYRFQLLQATLPEKAAAGETMEIRISLCNTGFAPMYNYRPVNLVLQSDEQTYTFPLNADPRRWVSEVKSIAIHENLKLPDTIAAGEYRMYLHLPDAYPSLAKDPRYAVRLANKDVWDAATGMNDLRASVVVSSPLTAIDNRPVPVKARKTIRDGQLIIVRGDRRYNAQGMLVE
ncbi:MAG: DUF4832 domain-containing protein [Paludibacteraceae bacterium]|nr:DUF4832 domain-containing protein [Paludibacteraceae bacterium]